MRSKINFAILLAGAGLLTVAVAYVQHQAALKEAKVDTGSGNWIYWVLALFFVVLITFLSIVLRQMKGLDLTLPAKSRTFRKWWSAVDAKLFTRAVAVDKEEDILLDHDYDGIKELDNALPPWWKYGFYITIGIAVIYLLRFHVWKTGPSPEDEYNTEMKIAAMQYEETRKSSKDNVDETTVTMADAAGIASGQKLFMTTCFACHGSKGEGGVGPNLTDNYWLHGGRINDVFKTIKYGVPEKGMQSWQKTFSPTQIKELASYIKSLKGTNPPNGKAPQGDLFTESSKEAVKDSTVKK